MDQHHSLIKTEAKSEINKDKNIKQSSHDH